MEYSEQTDGEEGAEEIARAIGQTFREEVDTRFPNWKTNEETLQAIRRAIITVVVQADALGRTLPPWRARVLPSRG